MSEALVPVLPASEMIHRLGLLCASVSGSVTSAHSKRNYELALKDFIEFWSKSELPLDRDLFEKYRDYLHLDLHRAASTINVRMSAVRKLVTEASECGFIEVQRAVAIQRVKNVPQRGVHTGNWLTREQAKEILTVPDRETLKGKRDHAILATLLGCALRRRELASLTFAHIEQREGRWVIANLVGKGNKKRTVPLPLWVKKAIDEWAAAAGIADGRVFRAVDKIGRLHGKGLSDRAVWDVVVGAAVEIGIEKLGAHDMRRTCAKLCRSRGGELEQIQLLLGHASVETTQRYLGTTQNLVSAVNDNLGLE